MVGSFVGLVRNRSTPTKEPTRRKLIVTEFISLDGVIDSPGGGDYVHAGWTFKDVKPSKNAYEIKGREQEDATARHPAGGGRRRPVTLYGVPRRSSPTRPGPTLAVSRAMASSSAAEGSAAAGRPGQSSTVSVQALMSGSAL